MSASPKNQRTPPPSKFEDYILNYEIGPNIGLFPISNNQMNYLEFPGYSSDPASIPGGHNTDSYLDIGFTFKFEEKKYQRLYVSSNGFCCFIDPDSPTFTPSHFLASVDSNHSIKDVFIKQHLVLAPWWDNLRTTWRNLYDTPQGGQVAFLYLLFLKYLNLLDFEHFSDFEYGKIPYPPGIDSTLGGIKYYRGFSSILGKFLLIRWNFFTNYAYTWNVGTCDVVIYESGCIEFRYDPIVFLGLSVESASVGIFCYGGTKGTPRYRDFGAILRPSGDSRGSYVNGGSVYDGSFTDTDGTNTGKYIVSLKSENWPAKGNSGAIFTFSPLRIRSRANKSIINLRDSSSFIRRNNNSLFDDQSSLPESSSTQLIEYPTMLPASLKASSGNHNSFAISNLFASGSIQIERKFNHNLSDSVFYDNIVDWRNKRR